MTKQAELKKQAYESDLKSRALSILIYLIDRSNQELTCFPAIPTMSRDLHISVSTVKRGLKELVDGGYISKESRFRERNKGQTSNLYTLVLFETAKVSEKEESMHVPDEQETSMAIEMGEQRHITFESIAENAHLINETNKKEVNMEVFEKPVRFRLRYENMFCIKECQIPLIKNTGKDYLNKVILKQFAWRQRKLCCWTGEGVSLIPP